MRRLLLTFLVLITVQFCCWAVTGRDITVKYDFVVDNIYYRFNSDQKSVAVTYNNNNYYPWQYMQLEPAYSGEVTIPESVTYENTVYPVTRIDVYAFYNCTELTAVHLPNTITEIGEQAFRYCKALTEIVLPSSVINLGPAFEGCSSLKEIIIPANVKSIGGLGSCVALEKVELQEGLETIEDACFYGCKSLKNIALPNSLKHIGHSSFRLCNLIENITIPESVSYIGGLAFNQCYALNTVNIMCNLRSVDISDDGQVTFLNIPTKNSCIFEGCKELNVHVPDPYDAISLLMTNAFAQQGSNGGAIPHFYVNNVLMTDFEIPDIFGGIIPSSCFLNVSDMKTLTLPQTIKYIGSNVFRNCSSLEKVYFPETLETIGTNAFEGCTSLKEIKFGKKIKDIQSLAFADCKALEKVDIGDLVNWCSVLTFPSDVYSSGSPSNPLTYAKKIYLNGKELNELIIPAGITTINPHVFNNCHRFDKLVIPSSVTTIGDYAFAGCGDLDNIVFKSPVNLQSIGAGSFARCISLTNVTIPDCITSLGTGAFRECTNLVNIKLPVGLTELPSNMFYGCKSLPSIDLPETLKKIGNWAFYNCSALTRIDIPASVEFIGTEPFRNSALKGVYIKDMAAWCNIKYGNLQEGGGWAYELKESNPLIRSHNLYLNGELVTDLEIPEGVETIESCAFWGGTCIRSVKLPNTLKTVKDHAFWYTKIRDVMIPNSVENMGKDAFTFLSFTNKKEKVNVYIDNLEQWFRNYGIGFYRSGYTSVRGHLNLYIKGGNETIPNENNVPMFDGLMAKKVEELVVPNSITNIGDYALASLSLNSVILHKGIENISSSSFQDAIVNYVYSQAKFPPSINSGTSQVTYLFSYNSPLTAIYVPKGCGNRYKTKWSSHADIIKEADQEVEGNQSSSSISELRAACTAINGATTYLDLTNATLDETVTTESLGTGKDNVLYYLPSGTTNITGDNIIIDGVAESVCLHDGASVSVPVEFTAKQVHYLRSFSSGDSHTLCLPFDMTLPKSMKAYSLNEETEDGKLRFSEVESIKANKPYLVVTNSDVENLIANNVKMEVTPDDMEDAGITDFEFRGTLQDISNEEAASIGAYALRKNFTWKPVGDGSASSDVAAFRAYLVPASNKAASSISCIINGLLIKGDVNNDGKVTITDAVAIMNYVFGNPSIDFNLDVADVNGDSKVTITDAVAVLDIILNSATDER